MQGFGYNLRRPMFQDPRVREALAYAFDFEWSNKNLFYGAYKRTRSYFDNSELAATGRAAGRRAEDPRKIPRPDPRRRVHDRIRPAQIRRLRQYPRRAARGAEAAEGGGLELQGREARQRRDRSALRVRDSARQSAIRAHRAALRQEPGADGDHRAGAHGRRGAIREADGDLRLRHDGRGLWRIAVARQRAARILGLEGGRRAGQPQPDRHQEQGRRRADRGADQGARPRRASSPTPARSTGSCNTATT